MKVKELIVQLLNEDMDDDVIIRTKDRDIVNVDGILAVSDPLFIGPGYCCLSTDVYLLQD